ncbi:lipid A biosynthesis acyltransferase [Moraxella sp. ZJ142]|uniref:LpxL/LpxP family acyltransferase n=1 Tax=Moraxella marmotae TaxID=3344520 RepID=UPI0035D515FE
MSCQSNSDHSCGCQTKKTATTPTKGTPSLTDTHKQTQMADAKPFLWSFLHPKNWGFWLVFLLILPLIYLPLRLQFWLGKQLGKLVFLLAKTRVKDTLINLKLAFSDKSDAERLAIARQVFINQGIGIFESLCAWFRPNVFVKTFSISGLQHLIDAQKNGKAVILLGGHYTTLDLGGRFCTQFFAADCVYRPQNNPLFEWFIYNARRRIFDEQISSRDMKKLITRIKAGRVIWYSPDQDFGLEHGVMATFFGVPAATITAQRRLAKMGDKTNPPAVIMMDMIRQTPDYIPRGRRPHYHISLSAALDNYPSDDEMLDAERINRLVETNIRKDVSQWMWFHRRFKNQADGKNYYHQDLS